jgi:DNA (cytosine-5)-methyltransferase 1
MHKNPIKSIDLFAGAGGFTLGFVQHFNGSLKSVWANDFNPAAVKTYNANFGDHCVGGDIVDILENQRGIIPQADIVIGGPPCQGFSLLNKQRQNDPRKQLWIPFMDIVDLSGARVFVIENVRQLLNSPEHQAIDERAKELGFLTTSALLCAADYGVSQLRYRAFIVGSRDIDPSSVFPPKQTHFKSDLATQLDMFNYDANPKPYRTVRDVIEDLPPPDGTEIRNIPPPLDLHFGRNPTELSKKRYRAIPEEGMNRFDLQRLAPELTPACWIRKKKGGTDLLGRLWWDRPAFTIRTEFFKPEKGRYLHPEQHRPITHREAARFQSFPDSFRFKGSKIEIARQIGNAVPPLLAKNVAASIERLLVAEPVYG